jgi:hypothetical protein
MAAAVGVIGLIALGEPFGRRWRRPADHRPGLYDPAIDIGLIKSRSNR